MLPSQAGGSVLTVTTLRSASRSDRVGVDAGQIELDHEILAVAAGIHRHHRRAGEGAGGAEDLLGEPV